MLKESPFSSFRRAPTPILKRLKDGKDSAVLSFRRAAVPVLKRLMNEKDAAVLSFRHAANPFARRIAENENAYLAFTMGEGMGPPLSGFGAMIIYTQIASHQALTLAPQINLSLPSFASAFVAWFAVLIPLSQMSGLVFENLQKKTDKINLSAISQKPAPFPGA